MIERPFWINNIQELWRHAPIVWLAGVRRSGKTTLAQSLPNGLYLNGDLPSVARELEDPEQFFKSVREPLVLCDEIHQLPDPTRFLKIAADHFPHLKILATGSSTLAAGKKFRDSLTGRKRTLRLAPVLYNELKAFDVRDTRERLYRGGLPPALLAPARDDGFYAEWLDSYYARDIQELFHVEKRTGFLKLLELVLRQSGGLGEVSSLARDAGLSRPTVMNYLNIFEVTQTIQILRPYHRGGRQEILHRPKIYGFDTGFIRYVNGWGELRPEDCGRLWEHLVLDTLRTALSHRAPHFWRDKAGREVDFVLPNAQGSADAVECKWTSRSFDPAGIKAFRQFHPHGRNFVTAPDVERRYEARFGELVVVFIPLEEMLLMPV